MKALWQILLLVAFTVYSFAQVTTSQPHWKKENVSGLYLHLNDPSAIEELHFTAGGAVIATIGMKNGPMTTPVFYWKLDNDKLRIESGENAVEELTLIKMDSQTLKAKRASGKIVEFTIVDPDANLSPAEKKLKSLIIHEFNFVDVDISKALGYLTTISKTLDPKHEGFNFSLDLNTKSSNPTKKIYRNISITLEDVPLSDVLRYINDQTNLDYKIEGNKVVFSLAPASEETSK